MRAQLELRGQEKGALWGNKAPGQLSATNGGEVAHSGHRREGDRQLQRNAVVRKWFPTGGARHFGGGKKLIGWQGWRSIDHDAAIFKDHRWVSECEGASAKRGAARIEIRSRRIISRSSTCRPQETGARAVP